MIEFLEVDGGRIACEVTGDGPLVVLGHGLGDRRNSFRFLAPMLVAAGYRVANADLRGHGESSTGWKSYTRTDSAKDFAALIRHLGGPAIFIGQSFSGGAAAILAAEDPSLVTAIIQMDPGTRKAPLKFGDLNWRFVKGISLIMGAAIFKSPGIWHRYLNHAFPVVRPADFESAISSLLSNLREPGRMDAAAKMVFAQPTDAGAALGRVQCPALVIMGTLDPDFPNPLSEAAGIAAMLPHGSYVMIEGAGHYPHTQFPQQVADAVLSFLKSHA